MANHNKNILFNKKNNNYERFLSMKILKKFLNHTQRCFFFKL